MRRQPTRKSTRHHSLPPKAHRSPLLLLVLALGVTLLALWFKEIYPPKSPETTPIANQSGSVSLILSTDRVELQPNQQSTLTLSYDSQNEHLTGIQAEITYDPTIIELSGFKPSSSFPSILQAPKAENGKLTFALGVAPGKNTGLTGHNPALTFKAKALKPGSTKLTLTNKSMATTSEQTINTLKEITNVNLVVADNKAP